MTIRERIGSVTKDGLRVALWATLLAAVASLLMFHVWNQYRITQTGYKIAEVTTEHRKLLERNKKLAIEAAVVGRTERPSNVARERYGLEPVGPNQVRTLTVSTDEHAALTME